MPDDRTLRQARVFERFWDALVSGRTVASPDELEPDVIRVARRLRALDRPVATDATFESRLWEDLMRSHAMPTHASDAGIPLRPTVRPHANGRSTAARPVSSYPPIPPGTARGRRSAEARDIPGRWGVTPRLALAAVLLLTLVAGLVALDPDLRRPDRADVIPAAVLRDATPSPSSGAPPLASLVLPADVVDDWDAVSLGMGLYTIPAGSETAWESDYRSCCPGARLFTVLSGQVTVAVDGGAQVVVPGAAPRSVPAESSVDLVTGDTLVTRYEDANHWSNPGAEPTEVLGALMVTGSPPGPDINPGWTVDGGDIKGEIALPQGPYTLTTVRRELAWDGKIPPPADGAHYLVVAAPGTEGFVSRGPDGSVNAHGADGTTMTVYLMLVSPAAEGDAATGSGTSGAESLAEVAMPDGVIASGERTDVALMLYTVPAGTTSRPAGTDFNGCCPGLDVAHVLGGTATVRGDGPMRLLPSGGGLEPVPVTAGTDVVIEPGDTLLFEEDVATDWTVADGGSLSLLWGLVLGGAILDPPFGPSTWVAEDIQMKGPVPFPVDPYAIRLWPTILAPGATLEPGPGDVQLVAAYPSENARIGEPGGYAYTNLGNEPLDLYVMTLSTTDPGPASPVAARRGALPDVVTMIPPASEPRPY